MLGGPTDALAALAMAKSTSVYEIFFLAADDYSFSKRKALHDFEYYCQENFVPPYVKLYVRKNVKLDDIVYYEFICGRFF